MCTRRANVTAAASSQFSRNHPRSRTQTPRVHHHRRLHQDRTPRRPDQGRRTHPQGRQAPAPRGRPRLRNPPDPLRHRRTLHPRVPHRPQDRHYRQPRPPQNARTRVQRNAPRRLARRRRQASAGWIFGRRSAWRAFEIMPSLEGARLIKEQSSSRRPSGGRIPGNSRHTEFPDFSKKKRQYPGRNLTPPLEHKHRRDPSSLRSSG